MTQPIRFAFALALCLFAPQFALAQTGVVQTTFVPAGAHVAGVAFPQRILSASELEWLPIEVFVAATQKEAGFDLLTLEQVTLSSQITEGAEPVQVGAVLRFSKPFDKAKAVAGVGKTVAEGRELTKAQHGQVEYLKVDGGAVAVAAPSDRVLLVAEETWLKQMLDAAQPPAGKPSRIAQLLSQADTKADFTGVVDMTALSGQITQALDKEKIPPEFAKYKRIPALISAITSSGSIRAGLKDRLVIQAKDEAAAKELETLIPEGLEAARKQMLAEVAKQPATTPVEKATVRYLERISMEFTAAFRPVRRASELSLEKDSGAGMTEIAILNALLMPAVAKVREAANEAKQE